MLFLFRPTLQQLQAVFPLFCLSHPTNNNQEKQPSIFPRASAGTSVFGYLSCWPTTTNPRGVNDAGSSIYRRGCRRLSPLFLLEEASNNPGLCRPRTKSRKPESTNLNTTSFLVVRARPRQQPAPAEHIGGRRRTTRRRQRRR